LKYGALSSQTGTLDIACAAHDTEVVVVWTERGGPPVAAPAREGGYGSKLLNRAMTVQLDFLRLERGGRYRDPSHDQRSPRTLGELRVDPLTIPLTLLGPVSPEIPRLHLDAVDVQVRHVN
jgi:hypothetical protein